MTQRRSNSVSYEQDMENPLCLCEYYNKNNQRTHLLMCCCNCEAFDKLCTSFLCCDDDDDEDNDLNKSHYNTNSSFFSKIKYFINKRRHLISDTLNEIGDRVRIPCPGGARKLSLDFLISFVSLVLYLTIGSTSFIFSLLTIIIFPILLYVRFFSSRLSYNKQQLNQQQKYNLLSTTPMLNSSSSANLKELSDKKHDDLKNANTKNTYRIQIAHYIVVNSLTMILVLFNFGLYDELSPVMSLNEKYFFNSIMLLALFIHFYLHCSNPGRMSSNESSNQQNPNSDVRLNASLDDNYCNKCKLKRGSNSTIGHCPICQTCIFNRDHHCFWLDNCIGYLNHKIFLFYLGVLYVIFIYSFSLIFKKLNSLECKVVSIWWSNTKFDGKEETFSCLFDVYYSNFNRATLTLLFIQLIPLITSLTLIIVQQFLFISIGLTQHQLFKLSQKKVRFSLGLFIADNLKINRLVLNWFSLLFRLRKKSDISNRESSDHLV